MSGVLALGATARAQLSPGPLSNAHRDLEGPLSCTSCHVFGQGEPVFTCLDCHTEIRSRVDAGQGYHGRIVKPEEQQRDCAACHRDHVGRNVNLVHWPRGQASFDHQETGYPLTGAHRDVECRTCHSLDYLDLDVLRAAKVQDPDRSFLGLPTACAQCHSDPHRGQVGSECERCHTTATFEDVSKFDHQQTKFPLTGRHGDVECAECHRRTEDGFVELNAFRSTSCRSCHEDPHGGAFAGACESCHSTSNWLPRNLSRSFDHAKTDFPLLGKHTGLSCNECHLGAKFSDPVAHEQCMDCHRDDDPHDGQFAGRSDRGECGACHVVEGFKPTTFTREMHQETDYPLAGKHLGVECEACHEPRGPDTVFAIRETGCKDCHEDAHHGDFERAPYRNDCNECHRVEGFQPSTFTLTRHQDGRFPLRGAHIAVACMECHRPDSSQAVAKTTFHFPKLDCIACHHDPHEGQFANDWVKTPEDNCQICHEITTWQALRQFDHNQTDFRLVDAHRTVSCGECHRRSDGVAGIEGVIFAAAPTACAGCHEDVHAGQFDQREPRQACSQCHTNVDWRPTQFDHSRLSSFPLDGAHQDVPCRGCHDDTQTVDGLDVTIYRGAPRHCEGCHDQTTLKKLHGER